MEGRRAVRVLIKYVAGPFSEPWSAVKKQGGSGLYLVNRNWLKERQRPGLTHVAVQCSLPCTFAARSCRSCGQRRQRPYTWPTVSTIFSPWRDRKSTHLNS